MNKDFKKQCVAFLKEYNKIYIELARLGNICSGDTSYTQFAAAIKELQSQGILSPVKSAGENHKNISLSYKYKVHKQLLVEDYKQKLQKKQLELNEHINLEAYFKLNEKTYEKDLPYIDLIHHYLTTKGLPEEEKYIPEVSYEMVRNEKWIGEEGGEALLKRIKLWDKIKLHERIEPLAFAIDVSKVYDDIQYHLIIENKTAYLYCIDHINETPFTSIIYGKGWQIVSSIKLFQKQLNNNKQNEFLYFGDLDHEGISILHSLGKVKEMQLALPFYTAMLSLENAWGKESQKVNELALQEFVQYFDDENKEHIHNVLNNKGYYPQEILTKENTIKILKEMRI